LKSKFIEIKNEQIIGEMVIGPMMTLNATIRTFFWFIHNQLIHFIMDPCCCWLFGTLAPSLWV